MPDLDQLRSEAEAAIAQATTAGELEDLRVRYLGRKSELTGILRSIATLPPEERGPTGKAANEARVTLEEVLDLRRQALEASELEERLQTDRIDVTLPGDPPQPIGHLHLITQTRRDIEDVFVGLGFQVIDGPEVEFDYYNFTTMNMPPAHPARAMQDTFYFSEQVLLRTHTSPLQTRSMELQPPPIYAIMPGRVYRRDSDATHTPMFHQVEGLAIDED
ncbi:MAG: phenylalanyl-tRNA synthetase alpha chain, partial [Thermoleophilaceae bacterium]|nr:phenylalanyl-tRNA synthetase alpha chain [Thermoleophilaceae bacterium]